MLLAIIAAVAIFVAVAAIITILSRVGSSPVERRIGRLQTATEEEELENVLRSDSGTFPFMRRFVSGAWSDATARQLRQAGWGLKVSEYLLLRILMAVFAGVATALVLGGSSLSIVFALVGAGVGYLIPGFILGFAQSRRIDKVNSQLAETLDLIANALRSGFAFTQAVELATKQAGSPIRDELLHYLRDVSLGASSEKALQELADRTGSYDLDMMVATILVQRTTGGNLAEILGNVAETIRERERIAGEIRALTASQRLTGLVLSIYPVFLAAIFFALAPTLMSVLIEESLGRILLAIALTLQIIGVITIRRILRPEV